MKALLAFIFMSSVTFASNFQGFYKLKLSNSAFFNELSFSVSKEGKVDIDQKEMIDAYAMMQTVVVKPLDESEDAGSIMTITLKWLNDGSLEMKKVRIFASNDQYIEPALISVFNIYNDGSATLGVDKNARLIFSKKPFEVTSKCNAKVRSYFMAQTFEAGYEFEWFDNEPKKLEEYFNSEYGYEDFEPGDYPKGSIVYQGANSYMSGTGEVAIVVEPKSCTILGEGLLWAE